MKFKSYSCLLHKGITFFLCAHLGNGHQMFNAKGGITNNLNLALVYFGDSFEKLRLGFELLFFYYV